MREMASSEMPLPLLQSAEQIQLLNDIDKLRSDGVQHHNISLPQLVVCGDQSSGKSSVLEALSNVNFPVGTGTCTRFATELALRRSPDRRASAKIQPGRDSSADRQRRLTDFQPSLVDLAGVPALVEEARTAMGLSEDRAICDDVLRLEITGPDLPHLTLVDLPGLIADAKDTKDIKLVEDMVKKYMENPRSIILAIVSAKNDKENQKVLRLARQFDPHGDRTVGVITKPDTLSNYRGSVAERAYIDMAKNQDPVSKLRLGWHVVRNPDYHEKQGTSTYNRTDQEKELFSKQPWNELSKWQLGIQPLRNELMKHLFNQICAQLPRVVEDIEREESKCEQEIKDLGEVRESAKDQRRYLHGISRRFEQLISAGLEGHWTSDPIFTVESMRLRAQIRNANDEFEKVMKIRGHTFEFKPSSRNEPPISFSLVGFHTGGNLLGKVNKILKSGRGQELPGMFDPILVSEIFRDQSQNWGDLVRQHADKVWRMTDHFLQSLLFKIAPAKTQTAEAVLNEIVSEEMRSRKKALDAKIEELLLPYVRNLPFCTPSRMTASLKQIDLEANTEGQFGRPDTQPNILVDTEIDVDACTMLLRYSQAYYNVARDTFSDNVVTLGVENCLLAGLAGIFSSDTILDMDDSVLAKLAGESEKTSSDRKYAEGKRRLLKQSLETCRTHMSKRRIFHKDYQTSLEQDLTRVSLSAPPPPPGSGLFGAATTPANPLPNWNTAAKSAVLPSGSAEQGPSLFATILERSAKQDPSPFTKIQDGSAKQDPSPFTKPSSVFGSAPSGGFGPAVPSNNSSSSTGLFNIAAGANPTGFGQSGFSSTPSRLLINPTVPFGHPVPKPAFGSQSPFAVSQTPSTTQGATPSSQATPPKSEASPPSLYFGFGNPPHHKEDKTKTVSNGLSHVDQSAKVEEQGHMVLYQSCTEALKEGKSYEEIRLEDQKKSGGFGVPQLMKS